MNNIPTPHISAKSNEIASKVLMPGDPRRAEWIAKNYLHNAKMVSNVRNICAYTGEYKGQKVTVMAHGMGIPSISIYSYELFNFYNVDTIFRIGSCGALDKKLELGDVVVVDCAWADVDVSKWLNLKLDDPHEIKANKKCLQNIISSANQDKVNISVGKVASVDFFYNKFTPEELIKMTGGAIGCEMEAFGLFAQAILAKKNAGCLLTVSDSIVTKKSMTSEQRETTFNNMVQIAFDAILK